MTLVTLTWPLSSDAQAYIAYHTARPTAKITFRLIYISLYCWRDPWQYSGQTLRISIFRGYQHKDTSCTKQEYVFDFWFIRRTNRRLLKCDTVLSGRVCWRFRRLVFRGDDEWRRWENHPNDRVLIPDTVSHLIMSDIFISILSCSVAV